jgi:ABC-2 type transport system permease protein
VPNILRINGKRKDTTIIYYAMKNIFVSVVVTAVGVATSVVIYIIKSTLFEGFIAKFFDWFSLLKRYQNFSMGILDVSSIVYYITFSTAFVFLTIRMLEKKRWS